MLGPALLPSCWVTLTPHTCSGQSPSSSSVTRQTHVPYCQWPPSVPRILTAGEELPRWEGSGGQVTMNSGAGNPEKAKAAWQGRNPSKAAKEGSTSLLPAVDTCLGCPLSVLVAQVELTQPHFLTHPHLLSQTVPYS